jgi:PAS domain S-box-containing protein
MENVDILLVEDESIVAMDLQRRLKNAGFGIAGHVVSGEAAVDFVRECQPDLILMDIQLKGKLDGIQSAEIIRKEYDIPVIFLTAFADKPTLERAKVTEAYAYILKPYQERELYTNIEIAIYKNKMERKLRESEHWLDTTLNSISEAVIAADIDGSIHLVNSAAERIFGISKAELIGRNIEELILNTLFSGKATQDHFSPWFIKRDGEPVPVERTETMLTEDGGRTLGKVLVLRDVSERYRFETALQQAKETAERASEAKSRFLAAVSHELRTPLNSILGMTEVCLDSAEARPDVLESVQLIQKQGENLLQVINSILQIARAGRESPKTTADTIAVPRFGRELFDQFSPAAAGKGLQFKCAVRGGCPDKVIGNGNIVFEIMEKLLENAFKFTPAGAVSLDIARQGDLGPAEGILISFTVTDTGKGLSREKVDRVFEPFFQEEDVYTRAHGGPGLGLSIAKQKSEILGGDIHVESEEGSGSTFTLVLPFQHAENAADLDSDITYILESKEAAGSASRDLQTFVRKAFELVESGRFKELEDAAGKMKDKTENREQFLKIILACRRGDTDILYKNLRSMQMETDG